MDRAPHESLFSTELIITLTEHFWDYYYKRIFVLCFIPYIVYFIATIIYVSTFSVDGISEDERYALTVEFVLRITIIISMIYFSVFEIDQILRQGWSYFLDVFNAFDWLAFLFNTIIIWNIVNDSDTKSPTDQPMAENRKNLRTIAAISIFFMWVKTFYWMRLFSSTSFYIRLIRETLNDVKYFLILFIFMLMCFGNAIYIMN